MTVLLCVLLLSGLLLPSALLPVSQAQVPTALTPDATLGTTVTRTGTVHTIAGGTRPGNGPNLFHSFDRFSVGTGDTARFTGPTGITNILSRVTGGQRSDIDGTLRSEIPGANLYVLNPSGVVFGPNARLEVSGSFHVSTADVIRLTDGGVFPANPAAPSLLTVAPPAAFGFLRENPAAITIQGSTLQVVEGKTLSVVGGDLTLVGNGPPITEQTVPTLGAPGGRIQLVSVAGPGEVRVSSPAGASDLQLEGVARLGRITLVQGALVTVPSEGSPNAGAIEVRGGQLTLSGGSQLGSTTRGAGQGGNLTVEADALSLSEGAGLQSRTEGGGSAGAVTIRARAVEIDSGGRISSHTFGPGTAGTVTVQAERLSLAGAGASSLAGILSLAEAGSTGDAGVVVVHADRLVIDGREDQGGTGIGSLALPESRGNSADTRVLGRDIELRNGGFIRSSTASPGTAGTVTVQAERLVLVGVGRGTIPGLPALRSAIASGVLPDATGAGGDVRVIAGTLEIQPGGGHHQYNPWPWERGDG